MCDVLHWDYMYYPISECPYYRGSIVYIIYFGQCLSVRPATSTHHLLQVGWKEVFEYNIIGGGGGL